MNDVTLFNSCVTLSGIKAVTFVPIDLFAILKEKIMKKIILTIAAFAFMATISTAYGQDSDKKSVKASENIQGTQKDTASEFQTFKKESEIRIKNIDNRIGGLKVTFYENKIKDKIAFQDNLNLLEQKTDDLQKKLADYKVMEQSKWVTFKLEFNHDLNEIAKSLNDFALNNK